MAKFFSVAVLFAFFTISKSTSAPTDSIEVDPDFEIDPDFDIDPDFGVDPIPSHSPSVTDGITITTRGGSNEWWYSCTLSNIPEGITIASVAMRHAHGHVWEKGDVAWDGSYYSFHQTASFVAPLSFKITATDGQELTAIDLIPSLETGSSSSGTINAMFTVNEMDNNHGAAPLEGVNEGENDEMGSGDDEDFSIPTLGGIPLWIYFIGIFGFCCFIVSGWCVYMYCKKRSLRIRSRPTSVIMDRGSTRMPSGSVESSESSVDLERGAIVVGMNDVCQDGGATTVPVEDIEVEVSMEMELEEIR